MITVNEVRKKYGRRHILHGVTFEAVAGRVTAFVGPNGAGKSSTLRILLGLDRATGGQALLNGMPYRAISQPLLSVGALLDGPGASAGRTAAHHLRWMARSNGIPPSRVAEVLENVGLAAHASERVGTFSLGMGQRLGIASALLGRPSTLVLDEPTNGLDPDGMRWLRGVLRERANAGDTVLVSSHLMGEMEMVADDLVVISHGAIVATGTVAEVRGEHPTLEHAFFALTDARQK